jgi:hypothetical protein
MRFRFHFARFDPADQLGLGDVLAVVEEVVGRAGVAGFAWPGRGSHGHF